jgi:hypothetical protein
MSLATGVRGPNRMVFLGVDYEVRVVLKNCVVMSILTGQLVSSVENLIGVKLIASRWIDYKVIVMEHILIKLYPDCS